jgi:hypothetical protein
VRPARATVVDTHGERRVAVRGVGRPAHAVGTARRAGASRAGGMGRRSSRRWPSSHRSAPGPCVSGPVRPPLDQRESGLFCAETASFRGGRGKNRTFNKRIKSPLLCQLSYTPEYSVVCRLSVLLRRGRALEVSRTPNPRLRRPMLYPVELRAHALGHGYLRHPGQPRQHRLCPMRAQPRPVLLGGPRGLPRRRRAGRDRRGAAGV